MCRGICFLFQHWSVPRHVTLWQKILVTLTGTIPLTLFTTSEEYSSRHVREPPNLFMCEVRRAPFLVCNPFLDAICRAQPPAGCKCIWEKLDRNWITHCIFTSKYCGIFRNHPSIWFLSQCNPFLDAVCRAQPRAGCKCKWERLISKPDHKPHLWPAGMSWCLTHGTDLSRHTHSSLEGRTY